MFCHLWGGDSLNDAPKNILLAPYFATRRYHKDVADSLDTSFADTWNTSSRGYDQKAKILAALAVCKEYWHDMFRLSVYFQATASSGSAGSGKHDYSVSASSVYILYAVNQRSPCSFIDAVDIFHKAFPYDIDLDTLVSTYKGNHISEIEQFEIVDNYSTNAETWAHGTYSAIESWLSKFKSFKKNLLYAEQTGMAACLLAAAGIDQLALASTNLLSAMSTSDIDSDSFDNALGPIRSDPDFQKASLLSITKDQLSLNRALYDSLSVPNREYGYVPATKAIIVNQTKKSIWFSKIIKIFKKRKFICISTISCSCWNSCWND